MTKIFSKIFLLLGIIFFIPTLILNILSLTKLENDFDSAFKPVPEELVEIYDANIAKIIDLDKLKELVNEEVEEKKYSGIDIPILVDDIVRRKFVHGLANINNKTNWLLEVANRLNSEKQFLSAMQPKDIVRFNYAFCNQQAIIFQEIVKDFGFEFASIGFNVKTKEENFGHFVSAVKVNQDWFYFDPNLEPNYNRRDSSVLKGVLEADKEILEKLYPRHDFDYVTEEMISFHSLNEFPAKGGVFFQKITFFFSNFLFLILLFVSLSLNILDKRRVK